MTHSITINPPDGITDEMIATVVVWLNKRKENYVYSIEKENEQRHMHIRLDTKKRSDNITRSLKTILNMNKMSKEWKVMCRVTHHGDPDYLTGYVCKDGTWVTFGFSAEDIAKARLYYEQTKNKTKSVKSIHLGNFDIEAENYCRANQLSLKETPLEEIFALMYISGEYRMNQFLFRHLKIPVTKLWDLRRTKDIRHVKDYTSELLSRSL